MEKLQRNDAEKTVTEYEVIADTSIVGELKYGPYKFKTWEVSNKSEGEKRKLLLQICETKYDDEKSKEEKKEKPYYHGGGIADELVILSSLFLRCRLYLGPITRMDDNPIMLNMKKAGWIDEQLIQGGCNLENIADLLKLVEGLNPELHQKFILAAKLYHQALLVIEEYPDIAYLNLVSAIEVLSGDTDIGKIELSEIDEKLAIYVDSIEDNTVKQNIKNHIIVRERFIRRRFVSFIIQHLDQSFWLRNRPEQGKIEKEELASLLRRIYDQRSRTLHTGEPFPISVFFSPIPPGAEISKAVRMKAMSKSWEAKDFIPYPHFFERIVNYVLKTYLFEN